MMQQAISHWIGAGPQGATGHSLESVMHNRGKRACAFDLPRSALGLTRWRGFPEGSSLGLTSLMTPRSYHLVDCHRNDPRPKAIGASFASCDTAAKKWPMPLRRSCTVPVTAEPLPTRFGAVVVSAPRKKGGPHDERCLMMNGLYASCSITTQPLVFFERSTGMALGGYYALEWDENGCAVSRPKQKLLDYSAHRGR